MTRLLAERRESGFALALLVLLLGVNLVLNPVRFRPASWGTEIGLATPLVAAAVATMPALLGGRGGIDVSVGPLMGLVNALLVQVMILDLGIRAPAPLVAACVLAGVTIGCVNGTLATLVRIQPIVATLGTYLLLSGVTLTILPAPAGSVPSWLKSLSGPLSIVPLGAMAAFWLVLKRTSYYDQLMAVGSDDRACFTAGVPVAAVRFLSYVLTGLFAGIAGLTLTALIGSGDPNVGPEYTLIAISAAALGGVSLAGGRGGFLAAAIGAADIFLLQNALTFFNVSTFVLQIAYGLILVVSVALSALPGRVSGRRR